MYEWAKVAHLVSVISWMVGFLYLPRLMVYHNESEPGSETSETFKVMERRLLVAIMTPGLESVIVAIALVTWPPVARLVRAEFLTLRSREFVEAARSVGIGHWQIIVREILPNALPPVIAVGSLMVATAILTEASLSFLGLADPNLISWGYIIGSSRPVFRQACRRAVKCWSTCARHC